jgi:integral membrane protein
VLRTPLGRLRVVGLVEGVSTLLLFFVAMPLKHFASRPEPVTVAGSIHGGLWLLFLAALAHVTVVRKWAPGRVFAAFVASVLPFGTFVFDRSLRREQQETKG